MGQDKLTRKLGEIAASRSARKYVYARFMYLRAKNIQDVPGGNGRPYNSR